MKYYSHLLSHDKSWLRPTIERDIEVYKKTVGIEFPFDGMYNLWKEQWGWGTQHIVCSIFPLIAFCNIGGSWGKIGNRHTGSLELGFEMYDTISRI